MISQKQMLLVLAALQLSAPLAFAAPVDRPTAPRADRGAAQPPAGTAGQTSDQALVVLTTAPALTCPTAEAVPSFLQTLEAAATDLCGPCSDAICIGKMPNAVCGVGFRCIPSTACTAGPMRRCRCLII